MRRYSSMGIPGSNGSSSALRVVCVLGLMEAFWSRSDDWVRIRSSPDKLEGAEGCCGDPRACSWSDGWSAARGDDGLKREDARLETRCLRRVANERQCCWFAFEFWAAQASYGAESDALAMIAGRQWERIPRRTAVVAGTRRSMVVSQK